MDPSTWIPPFAAHATLYGSKHYRTFDNRHFTFSGECTYLLAHDYRDNEFSVLVQYSKGKGKKADLVTSTIVLSDGVQIVLSSTQKVTVNGRRTELPYTYKETSVTRIGHTVRIHNEKGLSVECDIDNDKCITTISGWYFGRTAGLFGTYDNEPFTDTMASDGIRADDINTFTQSWGVGRCRATNRERQVEGDVTSPRMMGLSNLFRGNDSPYRVCFKQVDPEPFIQVGMNVIESKVRSNKLPGTVELGMCDSARFYVDECKMAGVPIHLPKECVKCENPESPKDLLTRGERITIDRLTKPMADLVFVVENGKCNKVLSKKIKSALFKLNKALSLNKVKNSKYALVSYGGEGDHAEPHSHTLNGYLFSTVGSLIKSMPSISFTHEHRADAVQALHFAASLPFRAGASKTVVLIPCSECHQDTMKYPVILKKLQDMDITLHVMVHKNIELDSKSPKASLPYGVDRLGVFTDKSHKDKELFGERALRRYVDVPKDICVVLAMDMDGSVFSAKQMMELRFAQQKRFYDILGRVVAKKAVPSDCQRCECSVDGQTVCRRCTPLVPYHLLKLAPTDNSTKPKTDDSTFDVDFKEVNKKTKKTAKPKKAVRKPRAKKSLKKAKH